MKKYKIGQIPNLTVRPGETVAFQVEANQGQPSRYSINSSPGVNGLMSINPWSGRFNFTPALESRDKVEVTITAKFPNQEETQKATFTFLPRLDAEYHIISANGRTPDSSSQNYRQISERDDRMAVFNNISETPTAVMTKKVVVSGVKVVCDENDRESLFRYSGRTDISEMTICADEVIIRGHLRLPGTKVMIYARSLVFEDVGEQKAYITTTPPDYSTRSEKDEGFKGNKAGDIYLCVKHMELPRFTNRLVALGGRGQDARLGQKGKDGQSITDIWNGRIDVRDIFKSKVTLDWGDELRKHVPEGCKPISAHIIGKYVWTSSLSTKDHFYYGSTDQWPGYGNPPEKMPGRPGQGGDGGNVYSALGEGKSAFLKAGATGKWAESIPPAAAGKPERYCRFEGEFTDTWLPGTLSKSKDNLKIAIYETYAGEGAEALGANPATPAGQDGGFKRLSSTDAWHWLHPLAVQAFMLYARDLFLAGKPEIVRAAVDEYLKDMVAAVDAGKASMEITSLATELGEMVKKIDGPYDYFGNPAGWVPMLSFEANLALYEQEIDRAMRMMFLAYWIEKNQQSAEKATALLENTLKQLKIESEQAAADYDAATRKLTGLAEQENSLQNAIKSLLIRLDTKERDLRRQAKDDLQRQHLFRASGKLLGGILQMVPVGQPALGAVGKGLSVLSDIDLNSPLDTAPKLASTLWETKLVQEKLKPKSIAAGKKLFGLSSADDAQAKSDESQTEEQKEIAKGVAKKKLADKIAKELEEEKAATKSLTDALSLFSVPEKELEAEIKRIKAACPEYKAIAEEIEAKNKEKAVYAAQIISVTHALNESAATILKNALAEIEMRSQRDEKITHLNHEARQYARVMGQRARDRMLKYYYYLVKSYNYLMVEPLEEKDVDYSAQYMIDAFTKMVAPKDGMLSSEQYRELRVAYENQLTAITDKIIGALETSGPKREPPFNVTLNPEQIAALNKGAQVTINLLKMGYLDLKWEDVRIVDIQTVEATVQNPPSRGSANVAIVYKHSGVSTIRRKGQLYLFRTGDYSAKSDGSEGVFWGAMVNFLNGTPTLEQMRYSQSAKNLIDQLLKDKGSNVSGLRQHEPSAWADIVISRSATPDTFPGRLENLSFKVITASRPVSNNTFTLFVRSLGDLQPYVECNKTDLNQRANGIGSFLRTFDATKTDIVKLTAAERFGELVFEGWSRHKEIYEYDPLKMIDRLDRQRELTLAVKASNSLVVEPVYRPALDSEIARDPWPAGVPGWTTHYWTLWNAKRGYAAPLNIQKVGTEANWRNGSPFDAPPGVLKGDDKIKVAFESAVVLKGEKVRFSVSADPNATPGNQPDRASLWVSFQLLFRMVFDYQGELLQVQSLMGQLSQFEIDRENRIVKFVG